MIKYATEMYLRVLENGHLPVITWTEGSEEVEPEIYNQLREEWYGEDEGQAVGPAGPE